MTLPRNGFTVVEALVALVLAALAAAALAAAVAAGARGLTTARNVSRAVLAGQDALGATVPGPSESGADVLAGDPPLARRWTVDPGRGGPTAIAVEVAWGSRALVLETSRWP